MNCKKQNNRNNTGRSAPPVPAGGVYMEVFGCQMNKLDGEIALEALINRGYRRTRNVEEAQTALFFTCAVRQHAEDRFFSRLGKAKFWKQRNPDLQVVVAGCIAEHHGPEIIKRFPFVDIVCGTRHFPSLPGLLDKTETDRSATATGDTMVTFRRRTNLGPVPEQAFVNVMRGCSLRCSYCIVPQVRGPAASRPPEEIEEEIQALAAEGVTEITLLGQTINFYGRDLGNGTAVKTGTSLAGLLRRLEAVRGIRRIHLVTSHPLFMDDELIRAIGEIPSVCEGLHLPAQSGSNRILKSMRRGYRREEYLAIISKCRDRIEGFEASGDFIVGFPGETDDDFLQTIDLIKQVDYQNLFIFKYSPRSGTSASRIPDDVPQEVKKERNQELLKLQETISGRKNSGMTGKKVEVFNTGPSARNKQKHAGRTRTGRIVIFPPAYPVGGFFPVTIEEATPLALYGTVANEGCEREKKDKKQLKQQKKR